MARVVLLLICTLLTMELTMASYSNNLINLIIRPAGRSRSFKWLGPGNIKNIPNVPRPIFIPRWIPRERPEYVAKWVPTTPGPQTNNIHSSQQSGFGPPKTNTVVQGQNAPLSYDVPPIKKPSASPIQVPAQPLTLLHATAPPITPAQVSSSVFPKEPPKTTGYAQPHADDIIQLDNALPASVPANSILSTSYVPDQPPTQQNIIPGTAIRNSIPETLAEPNFSSLVQDQLAVEINEFQPVDPNSVIIIDEGITNNKDTVNIVSDIILTDDPAGNLNSAEPITFQNLSDQNVPLLNQVSDQIQNVHQGDQNININEDELLFVVDSGPDLTASTLLDVPNGNLQSSQGDAGKSFDAPVLTQIIEPIQSHILPSQDLDAPIISQHNPDPFSFEDATFTSQPNLITKLNSDVVSNDILKIANNNQLNEPQPSSHPHTQQNDNSHNSHQVTEQLLVNDEFQITNVPQFIPELELNKSTDTTDLIFVSQQGPEFQQNFIPSNKDTDTTNLIPISQQGPEFQQNFIPSNINDVFLIGTEIIQTGENFPNDQQAQFSSFQVGQKINFGPLPIQDHDTSNKPTGPSLFNPALLAPPASPVIASERSFSKDHSDNEKPLIPSGRSISTDPVIPQPVPIPMGPLASLTLDFPVEGPGVRQARVGGGLLPFGTRLHSRPSRQFRSYPFLFGK
ncbi:LOW QUALITY PROTEIN: uncharacterized protein LOC135223588 [Macrobrachium nipponense]|uniref:LOW QUALITY PROTEIN: uncharacterized protein LOC135223588 n=1 Tax=Macrobrachium nipponense TaxID=159736 RepID=UPI0030C8AF05